MFQACITLNLTGYESDFEDSAAISFSAALKKDAEYVKMNITVLEKKIRIQGWLPSGTSKLRLKYIGKFNAKTRLQKRIVASKLTQAKSERNHMRRVFRDRQEDLRLRLVAMKLRHQKMLKLRRGYCGIRRIYKKATFTDGKPEKKRYFDLYLHRMNVERERRREEMRRRWENVRKAATSIF